MIGNPPGVSRVTPEPKNTEQGHQRQRNNQRAKRWASPGHFGDNPNDHPGQQAFDDEVGHSSHRLSTDGLWFESFTADIFTPESEYYYGLGTYPRLLVAREWLLSSKVSGTSVPLL